MTYYWNPMWYSVPLIQMVKPIELHKSQIDDDSCIVWNSFIQLLLNEPDKLTDIQLTAYLAFTYDAEIQNGGHLQYFENMYRRLKGRVDIAVSATLDAR